MAWRRFERPTPEPEKGRLAFRHHELVQLHTRSRTARGLYSLSSQADADLCCELLYLPLDAGRRRGDLVAKWPVYSRTGRDRFRRELLSGAEDRVCLLVLAPLSEGT